jgi:hypothetical protein
MQLIPAFARTNSFASLSTELDILWNCQCGLTASLVFSALLRSEIFEETCPQTARSEGAKSFIISCISVDSLFGLVVRVPGYRSRRPGLIPSATRFSEKKWVWNWVHSDS